MEPSSIERIKTMTAVKFVKGLEHQNNPSIPVDETKRNKHIDDLVTGNVPVAVQRVYRDFCNKHGRRTMDRRAARKFLKAYTPKR